MDKKAQEPRFEIQQNVSSPTMVSQGLLTPLSPFSPTTIEEKWIHQEYRKRLTVEEATRKEAQFAENLTGFLHIHAASVFLQATRQIVDMKDDPELNDEVSKYMEQFTKRVIESLGTRTLGLVDLATTNLAYTLYRDHYPPDDLDERKKRRGLFCR